MIRLECELGMTEAPHPVEEEHADDDRLVGRNLPRADAPLHRLASAADHECRLDAAVEREPGLAQRQFDAASRRVVGVHREWDSLSWFAPGQG